MTGFMTGPDLKTGQMSGHMPEFMTKLMQQSVVIVMALMTSPTTAAPIPVPAPAATPTSMSPALVTSQTTGLMTATQALMPTLTI
jgi:hypothetical protein